jgi:hypothetical protein
VRVSTDAGLALSSQPVVAPDDPGFDELRFPAQPARGWGDPQLLFALAAAALTVACCGRAGWRPRLALCALVTAGLFGPAQRMVPVLPRDLFYPPSPALEALRRGQPDGRMFQMIPFTFSAELPTYYGLHDVRGYDALYPHRVARLLRVASDIGIQRTPMELLPSSRDVDLRLLGAMAVQYLTDWHTAPPELERMHYEGEELLARNHPFPIVRNPHFLPRARLVSGAIVEPDDERALVLLGDKGFPRATTAVLAEGEACPVLVPDAGTARIVTDEPDLVRIEVGPAVAGRLILTDTHFPGWVADVDGEPRPIERANVAFRAVRVQPGERVVTFTYRPDAFRLGALLSWVMAGLGAICLAWSWLRPRARPPGD